MVSKSRRDNHARKRFPPHISHARHKYCIIGLISDEKHEQTSAHNQLRVEEALNGTTATSTMEIASAGLEVQLLHQRCKNFCNTKESLTHPDESMEPHLPKKAPSAFGSGLFAIGTIQPLSSHNSNLRGKNDQSADEIDIDKDNVHTPLADRTNKRSLPTSTCKG
ncbi:hypothetical protein HYFRA_00009394 [Hymenoscyphus fraxineus]|uniref:Uncharacterized protein n=1 Tax=Hymenoscyphus fraxineus TaxID=746836 RepID=A0A9N9L2X2_9HELO|nr:hypothetical protein HYFRA_00009394 [Hymenoscyphus fraxineus]